MVVIYSLIEKYKYTVITERDPILHEYYITKGAELWFTKYEQYKRCSRQEKKIPQASQEKTGRVTAGPLAPQEKPGPQRRGSL